MYFGRSAARKLCVCCSLTAAAVAGASFSPIRGRAALLHPYPLPSTTTSSRTASRLLFQRFITNQKPLAIIRGVTSSSRCLAGGNAPPPRTTCTSRERSLLWNPVIRKGRRSSPTFVKMSSDAPMSSSFSTTVPNIAANLQDVQDRVAAAAAVAAAQQCAVGSSSSSHPPQNVRLVAVSKTKPLTLLQAAYDAGCRCFGENYVQELVEKAQAWKDRRDVQWHYIGTLQSNKCRQLVQGCCCCGGGSEDNNNTLSLDVSRLTVETVSSIKLANKLNNAVQNLLDEAKGESVDQHAQQKLKVFVQVNTSREDSKSGVESWSECVELCRYIVDQCPALELRGLMTIGAIGDVSCFATLKTCRDEVLAALDGRVSELELSMGMSDDFEQAIQAGATNVRVGSTIFGARDYSQKS